MHRGFKFLWIRNYILLFYKHITLLLAWDEMSAEILHKFMRLCICFTDFYMVVYGFCIRIRLLCTFVYGFCARCASFEFIYGLSFSQVWCGPSRGIQSSGFFDLFCQCKRSWFVDSIEDPILRVTSSSFSAQAARYYWTVLRIWSWGFRRFLFPTSCSWFTVWSYLGGFLLILIEQYIYPGAVISLFTMLLCGSYKCRNEGY